MKASKFGTTKAGAHIAKVLPTAFASLVVFLVVGIWHGASWKYVAFGLWNGGVIMLSILMKPLFDSTLKKIHINPQSILWKLFQMLRTFIIVCIGYVFDVAPNFKQAIWTFGVCVCGQDIRDGLSSIKGLGLSVIDYAILVMGLIVVFLVSIIQEHTQQRICVLLDNRHFWLRYCSLMLLFMIVLFFGVFGPEAGTSTFVYAQF